MSNQEIRQVLETKVYFMLLKNLKNIFWQWYEMAYFCIFISQIWHFSWQPQPPPSGSIQRRLRKSFPPPACHRGERDHDTWSRGDMLIRGSAHLQLETANLALGPASLSTGDRVARPLDASGEDAPPPLVLNRLQVVWPSNTIRYSDWLGFL